MLTERLNQSVRALGALVERPGFGDGPVTVGAELELFLAGEGGLARPVNIEVAMAADDPRITIEGTRHIIEVNLTPVPLGGRPFCALRAEVEECLHLLAEAAEAFGSRPVLVGTLPTLRAGDLDHASLTRRPRYQALNDGLVWHRGGPFEVCVEREDTLHARWDSIGLVGAACSWQLHLAIAPARYQAHYNAAQLAFAPVLAAAGNSPVLLGRKLWHETRIPLYEQAVDDRDETARDQARPARGDFGQDWLRGGVVDLFAEFARHYRPVLSELSNEDPLAAVRAGTVPALTELRLHQSTVWRWNRPVYDPANGGHVRIELRALSSGPSALDLAANAAFLLGLVTWVAEELPDLADQFPFPLARANFYRSARDGLRAVLDWPSGPPRPAADLVLDLLPLAEAGLRRAGTDPADTAPLLAVVANRVRTGRTGAVWQRMALRELEVRTNWNEALTDMLRWYMRLSASGDPVHRWPIPGRTGIAT
jgi:gamma-glutamyl:cysteine ligase YbdK (ATP-grasp superfamily)